MRLCLTLLCLTTLPAFGQGLGNQGLGDPHLAVIPRAADEAARAAAILAPPTGFTAPEPFEAMAGGAMSLGRADAQAFSQPAPNLAPDRLMDFQLGRAIFGKLWVAAPASTKASDGLGPSYNARACADCHIRDGRGHPPEGPDDSRVSMVLRLSVPGGDGPAGIAEWLATKPEPTYGNQLQDFATPGQTPEGKLEVTYEDTTPISYNGKEILLRTPAYSITGLAHGPLAPDLLTSPRIAPPMVGLGLLEAIPAADILALADPEDANGDGISGRAAIVPSAEFGQPMLGRFGWKAAMPSLREQVADAFHTDMGLANPVFPDPAGDCTQAQATCRTARHGIESGLRDDLEVDAATLTVTTLYASALAVPARRSVDDPQVLRGKALFYGLNCSGCHHPKFVTHRLERRPEHSFQLIWPYSDLLLHDMGPGLADHRPEGRASGREWRTPPLWGIGLTQAVSGHTQFLHDGRARNLTEAILWHGGEAQAARDGFAGLAQDDRAALIAFLESL